MNKKIAVLDLQHPAIHEAGHAVAHVRLGISQSLCTIEPAGAFLGHVVAEGAEHVWTQEEARDQVIAYCAGYAALVAVGVDQDTAMLGADDDFEHATHLIDFWALQGNLHSWRGEAVDFMRDPANRAAVQRVADELMAVKTLDMDDVEILVEIGDGEMTEAEYADFKLFRERRRQR